MKCHEIKIELFKIALFLIINSYFSELLKIDRIE